MLEASYTIKDIILFFLGFFGVIASFYLCAILYNVYHILKNLQKITQTSSDMAAKVHNFVTGPINYLNSIGHKLSPVIEKSIRSFLEKKKKK